MNEETKKPESVPYFVYESEITRADIRFKELRRELHDMRSRMGHM